MYIIIIFIYSLLWEFPLIFWKKTLIIHLVKQVEKIFVQTIFNINVIKSSGKIYKTRFYEFLEKSFVLFENSFGFRNKESSSIVHDILDEGNSVLGIYLDVKKSFDSVDHKIVLIIIIIIFKLYNEISYSGYC